MSEPRVRLNNRLVMVATVALSVAGATITIVRAQNGTIRACVDQHSGEIKIAVGAKCRPGQSLLQWNQTGAPGAAGPPGPPGPSAVANVQYIVAGMFPSTSVSRAFCPPGTTVMGGGGFSVNQKGLQQSFPIADETGVIAFGSTAIGWQVAAEDFSDVQAFVVCVGR